MISLLSENKSIPEKVINKFKETLDLLPTAVFIVDKSKTILSWNAEAERISGYSAKEIVGRKCSTLMEDPCHKNCGLFNKNDSDPILERDCIIRTKSNNERKVIKNASYIKDDDGNIIGGIESFNEIKKYFQVEEEKQQSEIKFEKLIEAIDDPVFISDKEGVYHFMNKRAALQLGGKPSQFIGKNISDIFPERHAKEHINTIRTVIETGETYNNVVSTMVNDQCRWYLMKIFQYHENESSYAISIARDITLLKEKEKEIIEKSEFLDTIFSGTSIGLFVIGIKAENKFFIENINPSFERLFNLCEKDIKDRSLGILRKYVSSRYYTRLLSALKECISKKKAVSYDDYINFEDKKIHIHIILTPVKDGSNNISNVINSATDITYQKEVEEKLAAHSKSLEQTVKRRTKSLDLKNEKLRSEVSSHEITEKKLLQIVQEFEGLVSAGSSIIIRTNNKGLITKRQNQWEKFTGQIFNEYKGDKWLTAIHKNDRKTIKNKWEKAIEQKAAFSAEFRLLSAQYEEYRFMKAKFVPIYAWNKSIRVFMGTFTDISMLKKKSNQLVELNEELRRSNNELQQFAYVASHDLQEPLRMVSSYTQLLGKRYADKLDDDAREFINFATDGAKRMQIMINDLLEYSRITTRGDEFSEVSLLEILGIVHSNLNIKINENNALITNHNLPVVKADQSQMMRLFQNMIENALKYRSEKQPLISFTGIEKDDHWIIRVSDNGIGIKPEYFDRIFEIFERLHSKSEFSGTGIGLAVCKRIVERHGGNIWVESVPGKGSDFYFTLPK